MGEQGIKLFGQTIILKVKTEDPTSPNDPKIAENNNSTSPINKRPDKIIPCPRCKSMETKFCYFNNYNVNQPRHFCKGCHRYWTAGGALRNVPVGAGRRKNKFPCRTAAELRQSCFLDVDMHGVVVDEWHGFEVKRQRNEIESPGQTC